MDCQKFTNQTKLKAIVEEQNSEYIISEAPNDLTLRPIIADPACPTHRLSNLIDIIFKPLNQFVSSYIRDDIDFLSHLIQQIEESSILVRFDLTSLYTNIPHDLGIEAIKYWVERHKNIISERFSIEFIFRLR